MNAALFDGRFVTQTMKAAPVKRDACARIKK